eukprot:373983-Pyramimonas_sp.AAC.1
MLRIPRESLGAFREASQNPRKLFGCSKTVVDDHDHDDWFVDDHHDDDGNDNEDGEGDGDEDE